MLLPAQGDDTRRRPLLEDPNYKSHGALLRRRAMERSSYSTREGERRRRMSEFAGGTAAECAAVACCCPCGIVDLLVLAAYKVPAGLCRKALRKRRRRQAGKSAGPDGIGLQTCHCCCEKVHVEIHPITNHVAMINALESDDNEVIELEKEMWDKFYSAGFWRSQSMRSEITDVSELTAVSSDFDKRID